MLLKGLWRKVRHPNLLKKLGLNKLGIFVHYLLLGELQRLLEDYRLYEVLL